MEFRNEWALLRSLLVHDPFIRAIVVAIKILWIFKAAGVFIHDKDGLCHSDEIAPENGLTGFKFGESSSEEDQHQGAFGSVIKGVAQGDLIRARTGA